MGFRRTYLDPVFWLINIFGSSSSGDIEYRLRNGYNFLDFNAKVIHKLNNKFRLEAGSFFSNDRLKIGYDQTDKQGSFTSKERTRIGWNNLTGYSKLIFANETLKAQSQIFISRYRSQNYYKDEAEHVNDGRTRSFGGTQGYLTTNQSLGEAFQQTLRDIGWQQDFSVFFSEGLELGAGAQWIMHSMKEVESAQLTAYGFPSPPSGQPLPDPLPESTLVVDDQTETIERTVSHELSAYAGLTVRLGLLSLFPGVRSQHYSPGGHSDILPRINARLDLAHGWHIATGYGHFAQYIQNVGFDAVRAPTERWLWANAQRRPLRGRTFTAGVGRAHEKWGNVTLEAYYKTSEGLLNFSRENQAEAYNDAWSDFLNFFSLETVPGNGESYGMEVFWQKSTGRLKGWLGYTLSWAWEQFDELNRGHRFPSRIDKRHDIQTFWSWDWNENWSLGALFNFRSGQPVTLATGIILIDDDPLGINDEVGDERVVKEMNNFRLPAYHRLDVSVTWKNRRVFKRRSEWVLSVINLYNRINPLFIEQKVKLSPGQNNSIVVDPKNNIVGQMPIIPMISLKIGLGGDDKL